MAKSTININLDEDLKKESIELFSDLGMDLNTAITIFLKQAVKVQGLPFDVVDDNPNKGSIDAMNEYSKIKNHPDKYKHYISFNEVINEILNDN
jgi:DNA-damage-inducible protein J